MNTNQPVGGEESDVVRDPLRAAHDDGAGTNTFHGSTLDESTVKQVAGSHDWPGQVLGDYELLDKLGAGGMGVVYRARQRSANRLVALKVIRPDRLAELAPDTRAETLQRFLTEAQAAARLEHDHIVTVYDVGEANGQPFYSMRYVEGRSLSEILRDGPLDNRRAATFLEPVARAVHYAHEHGILHRDVKPRNILLDSSDRPYVADFGLAKLTEGTSDVTRTGQIMGTPEYMSPEQAQDASRATAASDVYSLGATLYDLLTGRPPFRAATPVETLRQVIEQDPVAPRQLNPGIDRDMETITLKSLQKESTRRYATADALADDLLRYLNGEPIQARPVGSMERLWRWCRRKPALASLAAALLGALTIGFLAINHQRQKAEWNLIRAKTQESLANSRLIEVEKQKQLVEGERDRAVSAEQHAKAEEENARQMLAMTQAVLDFFQNKVLAAARPQGQDGGLGHDVTLRKAIDAAEPMIAGAFPEEPLAEASIRHVLGETYVYLGDANQAIRQHERALQIRHAELGREHNDTLSSMNNVATAYQYAGRFSDALPLLEETLTLSMATRGPEHPDTLIIINNLALAYRNAGRLSDALPLLEDMLRIRKAKLDPDHPDTLVSMNNLALAYRDAGRLSDALPLQEQSLDLLKAKLGPEHPTTLVSMNNLALAYQSAGRVSDAVPLHEETLKLFKAQLGPEHPNTLQSMNNLATAYFEAGRDSDALRLHEETLNLQRSKLGADHPGTLQSMNNVAHVYREAGRLDEAELLFRDAVTAYRRTLGIAHPDSQTSMRNLAECYAKMRQPEKAEPIWRDLVAFWKEKAGAESPQYAGQLASLGLNLLQQRKPADAEPILRECLLIREKNEADAWTTFNTKSTLGGSLLGQKNYADAEPLLLAGYEGMNERAEKIPPAAKTRLTEAAERLVQLYNDWGQPDQAAKWRARLPSKPNLDGK